MHGLESSKGGEEYNDPIKIGEDVLSEIKKISRDPEKIGRIFPLDLDREIYDKIQKQKFAEISKFVTAFEGIMSKSSGKVIIERNLQNTQYTAVFTLEASDSRTTQKLEISLIPDHHHGIVYTNLTAFRDNLFTCKFLTIGDGTVGDFVGIDDLLTAKSMSIRGCRYLFKSPYKGADNLNPSFNMRPIKFDDEIKILEQKIISGTDMYKDFPELFN